MSEPDAEFDPLKSPDKPRSDASVSRNPAPDEPDTQAHADDIFDLVERRFLECIEPEELPRFDALIAENPDALAYWNRLNGLDPSFPISDQVIDDMHAQIGHALPWLLARPATAESLSELVFPPAPPPAHESDPIKDP